MEYVRKDLVIRRINLFDTLFKVGVLLFILLGIGRALFSYIAFGVLAVYLLFTSSEQCMNSMFFLLPFANVFKDSPEGPSFFTYLTVLLALKLIVSVKVIDKRFLFLWMSLFGIQLIGCNMEITLLIKQASLLLLIYGYFHSRCLSVERIVLNLSVGMLISCFIANMTTVFSRITDYMRVVRAYEISTNVYRFTGLYSDPNYLSKTLVLLCVSLFILIQKKKIGSRYWTLLVSLIIFGTQTISKSFFLMLAVMVIFFAIISVKNKHYGVLIGILIISILMISLIASKKLVIFENVLKRFISGDSLTTGRVEIWKEYIDLLLSDPLKLIFGAGIGNSMKYMAHNTYLDFLYYYGIIGSVVFIIGLKYAINKKKKYISIVNLAPFICAVIMSFFLSNLLMFDFAYDLILIISFIHEETIFGIEECRSCVA